MPHKNKQTCKSPPPLWIFLLHCLHPSVLFSLPHVLLLACFYISMHLLISEISWNWRQDLNAHLWKLSHRVTTLQRLHRIPLTSGGAFLVFLKWFLPLMEQVKSKKDVQQSSPLLVHSLGCYTVKYEQIIFYFFLITSEAGAIIKALILKNHH